MSPFLITILMIGLVLLIYSPIYFQRRRIENYVDEDLKKLDYEAWKQRGQSKIYVKTATRILWGLFIISAAFFNYQRSAAGKFDGAGIIFPVLGIALIGWGVLGFRRETKRFKKTETEF